MWTGAAKRRRLRVLIEAFEAELSGELTEPDKALIRQVSSLQLRIEQMQSAIVDGRDVNGDELVRLSSEHRRLLTSLRAKAAKAKPPPPTSLHELLAREENGA